MQCFFIRVLSLDISGLTRSDRGEAALMSLF